MLTLEEIAAALPAALGEIQISSLGPGLSGKVRRIYPIDNQLLLITTDRLSAFDRILGLIPFKGQILTQLSAFWFESTRDIVDNHFLEQLDPNVSLVQRCDPLPIEVIVRGYISGVTETSLWRRYSQGARSIYGYTFDDGLSKNDPLPEPILTPTTKARDGGHDEAVTAAQILERQLVDPDLWHEIEQVSLALFRRGQEIAAAGEMILVDTKYEFGLDPEGRLTLIDEVHTPDSSRFWDGTSYQARIEVGDEPVNYDKEFVRLHYAATGYRGDGDPPPLPEHLAVEAAQRYIGAFERITGTDFVPASYPAEARIEQAINRWLR